MSMSGLGDRPEWLRRQRRVPALSEREGLVVWLALVVVLAALFGWASYDEARTYAQRGAFTTAPVLLVDDCEHPRWGSIQVEVLGERAYLGCTKPFPRVGDRLRVQYDTDDPSLARQVGAGEDSVALVVMAGGGAACALVLMGWVLLRRFQVWLRPEVEERFRAELLEREKVEEEARSAQQPLSPQVRARRESGRGLSWRWPSHRGRHRS